MFDYSLAHWLGFFAAGIALELAPGPDYLFIATQTARHGRGHGFAAMFGIWTGALVHIAATALGLAAILARSATAFALIKWVGAAYLVWLGIQALRHAGHAPDQATPLAAAAPSRWMAYRQGILIDLLNPKVALFFLAFIPQFVVPGAGPVAAQLALHGVLLIGIAALFEPLLIVVGARLAGAFRRRRGLSAWAERGVGAVFIGLGAKLALAQR
ncbi:LysE family translocator [Salinisphaera sp. Q1T1-3]|uniref:LysE family translocator n=1 Tax=Salinisphaera sp. Q1T1-3 TaxID=2321229 RepID=UPI000E732658|nr:LysE family translocator [Salinisphaera sp. Q1T1-3]RJS91616.1 LysE family translocator [Salinisphaera sp. Q1T1-3]